MSTTVPPRDGDVPSDSHHALLANEAALRLVFLSEFPSITAEARSALGADAPALGPKVVEGAFVRAWDARAGLTTAAELHQFLVDDVRHASARALSRRAAAHRLGGHDARTASHAVEEVDAEHSWTRVLQAINGESHSPRALAEAAAISRHEAAEHIAVIEKEGKWWIPVGIVVALVALVVGGVMWIDYVGADSKIAQQVNAADVRVVAAIPGQIGVVSLHDGTKARLAPESKLSIPQSFGPDLRAVKLEGAGNFEVAPGLKRDFQVRARNAVIEAKGTSFTVRAYPGDSAVTVVVGTGAVQVRRGKERQDVSAGKGLVVSEGSALRAATPAELDEADGWRKGTFAVTNRPLREVLPELKRWYGLDVHAEKPALLARPVTLRASLDSSNQAIRGVEQSTGLAFGYAGQNMVFREREAKAKATARAKPKAKAKKGR
jgi:ferric-dicitrate binding protein FerR (iron transport regulator)